jgi:uncharacterized protein YbcI
MVDLLGEHQIGGPQSPTALICQGAVQLFRDYTGKGPPQARVSVKDDLVLIVLRGTLTKAESKLAAAGCEKEVLRLRDAAQGAMRDQLVALVEQQVGRKVEAFFSNNSIDPDLAIELFVLDGAKSP